MISVTPRVTPKLYARRAQAAPNTRRAFTLIELLIVMAIIAILAALLLPALKTAKQKAEGVYCLNNTKQLMAATLMYASDNEDRLPPNGDDDDDGTFWVAGNMNNAGDAISLPNVTDPRLALLTPYVGRAIGLYKCPGDKSTATANTITRPRVRSYSMNAAVGTLAGSDMPINGQPVWGRWLDGTGGHRPNHPWRTYGRLRDVIDPGPAGLWVFVDEDQNSIDYGSFNVSMVSHTTSMMDWPATYHNFAGCFVFADGHSESHKWRDPRTRKRTVHGPGRMNLPVAQSSPNNADISWIQERTTAAAPIEPPRR